MPDLSFSEMAFLDPRRAKPAEPVKSSSNQRHEKMKQRKSTKAADTEAGISRYFTSTKPAEQTQGARRPQHKHRQSPKEIRTHESPPAYVDLPDKPFLGFGSCGTHSASPVKRLSGSALKDLEGKLAQSPRHSSSYLTWSDTNAPSRSTHTQERTFVPLQSSELSNRNARFLDLRATPPPPPHPLNSPSDLSKITTRERNFINGPTSRENRIVGSYHHSANRSPKTKVRLPIRRAAANEPQEIAQAKINDRVDVQCKEEGAVPIRQICSPQVQSYGKPMGLGLQNTIVSPPQIPGPENPPCNGPLQDALETLLSQLKAERMAGAQQSSMERTTSDDPRRSEAVIDDGTIRVPIVSSGGDTCHKPHSLPSEAPNSVPLREGHWPGSRRLAMSPLLHNTIALLRPPSNTALRKTSPAHSSKGDTRSAWTGYDSMYERQQDLKYDISLDSGSYPVDNHHRNPNDYDPNRTNQVHSEYYDQQRNNHDYQEEAIDHGETGPSQVADFDYRPACDEFEEPNSFNGWENSEEHPLAEYEYRQDISSGQQHLTHFEEPQQQHFQIAEGSGSGNIEYMQQSVDDPAFADFWTPHKLY